MPPYAINKKAKFEYDILETYEAGLVLSGSEVKSIRNGNIKLTGAYVTFHENAAYLLNAHVSHYRYASADPNYDPTHSRKLLLKAKEIHYLRGKLTEAGLTIIPLFVYTKGDKIKVEIGLGRGRKIFDKREAVKKRESQREMQRKIKGDDRIR